MNWLWYALFGAVSGVLGGMGMGGGTVLIPFLSIVFGMPQHAAQAINLISFIPMSVVALIIHAKNGLVVKKGLWQIILSGTISCVLGFFIASAVKGEVLKKIFGGFLLILSIIQITSAFSEKRKKR